MKGHSSGSVEYLHLAFLLVCLVLVIGDSLKKNKCLVHVACCVRVAT